MSKRREWRELGMGGRITRRDFVNGTLAGAAGASSMTALPSAGTGNAGDVFTGYGGVGDYAKANGNTWPVVQAAHRLRDGVYTEAALARARSAGEMDLIVVGGGIAGLSAAHYYLRAGGGRRVLILENHPMLGGEARQNEFSVDGIRLVGPQGSNGFGVPVAGSQTAADLFFEEFKLPRDYAWQSWDASLKPLRFARDNYSNMDGFQEAQIDVGYHFAAQGKMGWQRNIWSRGLENTPWTEAGRRDLLRWRANHGPVSDAESRYLDTLTYKEYLESVRGYDPAVTRFVEPVVGLLAGVSTDAASARLGRALVEPPEGPMAFSFPGGNAVFARALLRGLVPQALPAAGFDGLLDGTVNVAALDRADQAVRLRVGATVLRVGHATDRRVQVVYELGGSLHQVGARNVVMASGGWVNKHLLTDMPADLRSAYAQFAYAPALIVNIAVRQWRWMYDLGVTACRWFDEDGIGYCCNLRQSMVTGAQAPALHPDRPAVISFYMGFPIPGLPAAQQGMAARARFFNTPYADFEARVRRQMVALFSAQGFDPRRDIAAIVLNRWGHARLIEPPGFHYGIDGRPSPLERVREGYGRVAIGHSELNGAQHWGSALDYGRRAGERAAAQTT